MRLSIPEHLYAAHRVFTIPHARKVTARKSGRCCLYWVGIIRRLEVRARLVHIFFSDKPPENLDGAENSAENSSPRDIDILATGTNLVCDIRSG